jgi:hypothetical protein
LARRDSRGEWVERLHGLVDGLGRFRLSSSLDGKWIGIYL